MLSTTSLAPLNAVLNSTAAILLLAGYIAIRNHRIRIHRACMITAFIVSVAFFISYCIYHYHVGDVRFGGRGLVRPVYFSDSDFARHARGGDCAVGVDDAQSRATRSFRAPSAHRAMDLANLDVCVGDRRGRLCDGVPAISAAAASGATTAAPETRAATVATAR